MKKFLIGLTLFCCLFSSPLSAQELSASEQETPFGAVRFLSCTDALRSYSTNYLAVAIFHKPEWKIQHVNLVPSTSNNSPVQLFTPFEQPFDTELLYPISSVLIDKDKNPITFSVDGEIIACNEASCSTHPIHLALTLTHKLPIMTSACSAITIAIASTPIPMHMDMLKGWAIPALDNTTNITLDFEHTPKILQLYDINKQPLNLDLNLHKKRLQFTWPTQEKNIKFFIRTDRHVYEVELPLLPPNTSVPQFSFSLFLSTLCLSFFFVLMSAFPIYWARITDTSLPTFKKQAIKTLIMISICFFAAVIALQFFGKLPLTYYPFSKILTLVLMGLGLLYIPAHPLLAILLTFIAPRPYLSDTITYMEQLLFLILSTFWLFVVFSFQLFFGKSILATLQSHKNDSFIWWIVRIPWIFLMIYTLIYL